MKKKKNCASESRWKEDRETDRYLEGKKSPEREREGGGRRERREERERAGRREREREERESKINFGRRSVTRTANQ